MNTAPLSANTGITENYNQLLNKAVWFEMQPQSVSPRCLLCLRLSSSCLLSDAVLKRWLGDEPRCPENHDFITLLSFNGNCLVTFSNSCCRESKMWRKVFSRAVMGAWDVGSVNPADSVVSLGMAQIGQISKIFQLLDSFFGPFCFAFSQDYFKIMRKDCCWSNYFFIPFSRHSLF